MHIMKTKPQPSDREVLAGLVERVTYQNADNGFCVIRVKARGHRDLVTVVGHAAVISAGEWITAAGDWTNDRTHGQQFKARFLKTSAPTSVEGIEKYLASGMIRGIGPVYAKKLLRAFGEKVFDVIEAEPDRLREVDGIGLTEVFRQAAASRIIVNAHRINQGVIPDLGKPDAESDFYFVEAADPETAVPRIIELVKTRIPRRFGLDSIRDIQVLSPMNRGGVGARSLNIELQAALNPAGERKVERFGWTFAPGDKVMQIENDYDKEVYNGDIGYVENVEPDDGELTARFDGRSVTYGFGELDALVLAYAATIHKSQGSEYPAVVIPVTTQHYTMLQRNLLYTGVTRGKRLVVLVGQKKAVAIAVRSVSGRRRWSKLREWLQSAAAGRGRGTT
jgi:ATP-dependent exoDNAse (exonuclease V) alpha subunit